MDTNKHIQSVDRKMKLDCLLPDFQFNECHFKKINASHNRILQSIKALTPAEISPVFNLLFFIRSIPAIVAGQKKEKFQPKTTLLEQMQKSGFKILAETDNEIVLGVIGEFWKLKDNIGYTIKDGEDFKTFSHSGFGKAGANFFLEEKADHILVTTETRILLPDEETRRKFARYWRIIYPGSALIRRVWLNAIKQKAESALFYRN